MATKAKLEGNARYLAKFKTVSIRFPAEEWPAIESAARVAGKAVSAFTVDAVREKIQREEGKT